MPILTWLLRENGVICPIQSLWADLYRLPKKPPLMSREEFQAILDLYPCDLLFVHRDSDLNLASFLSRSQFRLFPTLTVSKHIYS